MPAITDSQYGGLSRLIIRNLMLRILPPKLSLALNYLTNFKIRQLDPKLNQLCTYLGSLDHPTILDIGGNIGLYSYAFSRVNSEPIIHVYEPQPWNANYLKKAFRHIPNVNIHSYGLSDSTADLTINVPYLKGFGVLGRLDALASISSISNDKNLLSKQSNIHLRHPKDDNTLANINTVDCIKIDVEGHELSVVSGLADLIATFKPVLYIESSDSNVHQLYQLLQKLGYVQVINISCSSILNTVEMETDDKIKYQEDSNYFFVPID